MAAAASAAAAAGGPEHLSSINLASLHEDPHTGRIREWQPIWSGQAVYWHNRDTNETQWETPSLVAAFWAYRDRERAQRAQPPPPARGPPQRPPIPPPAPPAPASDATMTVTKDPAAGDPAARDQGRDEAEADQSEPGFPGRASTDGDSAGADEHAMDEEGCVVEPPESGDEVEAGDAGGAEGADAWEARDTENGEVYYFNTQTGDMQWDVPDVLLAMPDSEEEDEGEQEAEVDQQEARAGPASEGAVPEASRGPQGGDGDEGSPSPGDHAADAEAAAHMAEASAAARRESAVQLIHRAFTGLLRERGVGPFAQWSAWLPRLVAEPRFRAVPTMSERHDLFRQFVRAQRGEAGRRRREGRDRAAALLRDALRKSGAESRLARDTPVEKALSLVQSSGAADATDCLQQAFQLVGNQGAMGKLLHQVVLDAVDEQERKRAEQAEAAKPGSQQRKRARNAARVAAAAVLGGGEGGPSPTTVTAPPKRRRADAPQASAASDQGGDADGLRNDGERRFCDLVREVGSRAGWSRDTPWSAVARSLLRSDPRYEEVEDRKRRKELFEQVTAGLERSRVDEGQRKQLLSVYDRRVVVKGDGERNRLVEDAPQSGARGVRDRALEVAHANQRERELFGRRRDT